ncbi:MAG TPA: tetratricopeptide repeat protein [Pyrinomonadaceae bacterium]|nr:tetratricopeptide repeat protein [Pyrinomonadaceae bacterium]
MFRKTVFTAVIFAISLTAYLQVNAQTSEETELANLITKADSNFDLNKLEPAAEYLVQAKKIIDRNPSIDTNLQGHFYKVSGKLSMKNSFAEALEYYNLASTKFDRNNAEIARVKFFIGIAYYYAKDFRTAELYFQEAKEYFTLNRDNANLAQTLNNLGVTAFEQGNKESAIELCRHALAINLELENTLNASRNQSNLDYFNGNEFYVPNKNSQTKPVIIDHGGGGGSGSGTTVDTSGGGTVTVGGGGNGGGTGGFTSNFFK